MLVGWLLAGWQAGRLLASWLLAACWLLAAWLAAGCWLLPGWLAGPWLLAGSVAGGSLDGRLLAGCLAGSRWPTGTFFPPHSFPFSVKAY